MRPDFASCITLDERTDLLAYSNRPSHIVYGNTECGGRFAVRRGRCGLWGFAAIGAGLFILLALVLPAEFWWFFLAAGLIGLGIWYLRCCG